MCQAATPYPQHLELFHTCRISLKRLPSRGTAGARGRCGGLPASSSLPNCVHRMETKCTHARTRATCKNTRAPNVQRVGETPATSPCSGTMQGRPTWPRAPSRLSMGWSSCKGSSSYRQKRSEHCVVPDRPPHPPPHTPTHRQTQHLASQLTTPSSTVSKSSFGVSPLLYISNVKSSKATACNQGAV